MGLFRKKEPWFVKIARELNIEDELFLMLLEKKLDGSEMKEWYSTTDVYVTLLGRHSRTFQAWERQSGFPVRKPVRGKLIPAHGRAYTSKQVIEILWWWWNNRALERRGREGGDVDESSS